MNTVTIFYDNLRVKSHGYTCDSDKDSYNAEQSNCFPFSHETLITTGPV